MSNRLFAFGCSFTRYGWPTWADIMGQKFDSYENWGASGAGNQYIFNALIECDIRNKITPNDTVTIMWTNFCRDDHYERGRWQLHGNVYHTELFDSEDRHRIRGYYIRDLATIHATRLLLEARGCQYHFMSMVDIDNPLQYQAANAGDYVNDLLNHYQETLDQILPSVHRTIFDLDWHSRPFCPEFSQQQVRKNYEDNAGPDWPSWEQYMAQDFLNVPRSVLKEILDNPQWNWRDWFHSMKRGDFHPTPAEHLEYLNTVLPEYQFDHQTVLLIHEIDAKIRNKEEYEDLLNNFTNNVQDWPRRW